MSKREKQVYKNIQELAHVWAQQTKDSGRLGYSSGGGMFGRGYSGVRAFFRGTAIYSYGEHYKMAQFHGDIVLVNSTRYSNTTTSHQYSVTNAITHKKTFRVPNVENPRAIENIQFLSNEAANEYTRIISRLRAYSFNCDDLLKAIETHNDYLKTFKIRNVKPIVLNDLDLQILKALTKIQCARQQEHAAKRRAQCVENQRQREIHEAKQRAEELAKFEAWKRGENVSLNTYYLPRLEYDVVRVKGNEVETHRGASVPLNLVHALLSKIDAGNKVNGFKIGDYTVTSKSGDVIKIGCHTFKISEARKTIEQQFKLIQGGLK